MRKIKLLLTILGISVLISGCSTFSGSTSDVTDTYTTEFTDVPIPKDMEPVDSDTEISNTGNVRTGHMRFSGSVEWLSLINACLYNMHGQGWSPLAIYKNKNGLLVFEKDARLCVMMITDSLTNTQMRVWVSPRMHGFTVPPSMPVGPAPVEASEAYQEVGGGTQTTTTDSYQPAATTGTSSQTYSGGGVNESGLSE